jgi:predicted acetyltransferase
MPGQCEVGRHREAAELTRFRDIVGDAFLIPPDRGDSYLRLAGHENVRVVRIDGNVVGGLLVLPAGQWFGRRRVPMVGIAAVAVAPECRAHGAATRLLTCVLEELRQTGVAISTLYPATVALYRRVGYEPAGYACDIGLPIKTIDLRDRELTVRPAEPEDEPSVRDVYNRWAAGTNGNLDRTEVFWHRAHHPRGEDAKGYLILRGKDVEGYGLVLTQTDQNRNHLRLQDAAWLSPAAMRRLLTFLADYRTIRDQLLYRAGPADPMLSILAEAHYTIENRALWMTRIVDVHQALEARGYPPGLKAELNLAVRDDILPANAGRYVLRVAEGRGTVQPGGSGAIEIDIRGLAALYTGYRGVSDLRIAELASGPEDELAVAGTVFAGPAPWMRDEF